jgi:predicted aspartyl protease
MTNFRRGLFLLVSFLANPGLVPGAHSPENIPFKIYRGYVIVVEGSIADFSNLHFVIDTGAVPSVVDGRIARKLKVGASPDHVTLFTRNATTKRATVPNLQLGPIRTSGLEILVGDLSFLGDSLGIRIDALIGTDVLSASSFTLDYTSKKINFGPANASLPSIPYDPSLPYLVVQLLIQGRPLRLLVDTGAKGLVLFESRVRESQIPVRTVGRETWTNMAGEAEVKRVELLNVQLGPKHWEKRDATILEGTGPDPSAPIDGLLGVSALEAKHVVFDFSRKRLAWEQ